MTDPNEKPWFKGVDVEGIFQREFFNFGLRLRWIDEVIDSVKTIKKGYLRKYKKFFEGIGKSWTYSDKEDAAIKNNRQYGLILISHTTWLWFKRLFKIHAEPWNIIIHEVDPMSPLFRPPLKRTKNFLTAFPNEARVCKEAIIHWPTCPECREKFFWRYIKTKNQEEMYELFDNRELYCSNRKCSLYGADTDIWITDIVLPSSEDTKIFIRPFLQSQKRRRKNLQQDPENLALPRRWIRFWVDQGYRFPRKPRIYASDTSIEKHLNKFNISPYHDLQNENLNPYPNG